MLHAYPLTTRRKQRRASVEFKMHALMLSQIFPPDTGGSATRAYNVAKGPVLNRAKVTVVAARA